MLAQGGARLIGQRFEESVAIDPGGPHQQLFGRSLDEQQCSFGSAMDGHQALALRLERNLVDSGQDMVSPCGLRQVDERQIHRIADPFRAGIGIRPLQIVAVSGTFEQVPVCCREFRVGGFIDRDGPIRHVDRASIHSVLRRRPCLVRADDRRRAQSLDARQMAHQSVPLRHPSCGHRHGQGYCRQQALGDVGNNDADRENQSYPCRQTGDAPDHEYGEADGQSQTGDQPAERGNLVLQWRRHVTRGLSETGDAAEYRVHSRREDQCLRLARRHRGSGQQDVAAPQQV